jgi:hypothetical protein
MLLQKIVLTLIIKFPLIFFKQYHVKVIYEKVFKKNLGNDRWMYINKHSIFIWPADSEKYVR